MDWTLSHDQSEVRRFLIGLQRLVQSSDAVAEPVEGEGLAHCRSVSAKLTLFGVHA